MRHAISRLFTAAMPMQQLSRQFGIFAIAAAAANAGCATTDTTLHNPDECNIRIVSVTPAVATLSIGDTVTLHASYVAGISAACIPDVPATSLRWGSTDPATVAIDSLTGTVTAHRAGSASVTLHVPGSSSSFGGAQVTVTAP
jgi:plastocyanin